MTPAIGERIASASRIDDVIEVLSMATKELSAAVRLRASGRSFVGWLARHRRWVIPLAFIPISYVLGVLGGSAIQSANATNQNGWLILAMLALWFAALIGPIVAAVLAVVGGVRTYRMWRRANGHFPRAEQAAYDAAVASRQGANDAWDAARLLRDDLISGQVPPTIAIWEIVPRVGEVMLLDLPAEYSRYYGRDVSYDRSSGFFFGHPLFVVAGLAATAVGNASRRSSAEAQARQQWREQQPTRVVVTNQRLACLVGGQWLSFDYGAITAVYPETGSWTLICQFSSAEPLRLSGHGAPLISVITVMMTHGREALVGHPNIKALGS